jgi:chemosensory pili system protein ChpA (sensor histidine kinase/response regulator)
MAEVSSQTLHIVSRELGSELNEARAALEAFGEQQENIALLRKCIEHLHSVHGALRVAEVYGAALLAEEMTQVGRYLLDNFAEKRHLAEGLDALMRAMIQLPTYLDRVLSGGRDMALVLLPLLNDLRAVRGNALLSEGTLLLLNLSSDKQASSSSSTETDPALAASRWARKLRTRFQLGLLGWIKGERVDQNLEILARAAERLEQVATTQPVFQLWWVVGAIIEALREGGLEGGASLKRLLGQADREMKRLYEQGELAYSESPPLDLLNNLLYYVARARSTGPRATAVSASFRLSELLPIDDQVEQARESLSAPSVKLMKTVAAAIKEDLGRVKDALDIFVRQGSTQADELTPQLELLKKIGDTLGVLGLGDLRDKVQTETADLQTMLAQRTVPNEGALLRMAATLIKVEDSLDEQLIGMIVPPSEPDGAPREQPPGVDEIEFRQVTEAVLRECIVNMARIKEAIAFSVEKPQEAQGIDQIPQLMRGISAGLLMLGKTRVVEIVEGIERAVRQFVRTDGMTLPQEAVDRLADAIVAVEYYMETLQAGRTDPWYMLDNAESCLRFLAETQPVARAPLSSESDPARTMVIQPMSQTVTVAADSAAADERTEVLDRARVAPPPTLRSIAPAPLATPRAAAAPPPVLAKPVDREIDPEFLEIFIEEAKSEVTKIQERFPLWEENPQDQDALVNVRRSFHTLKGSGRMVGAQLIGEFAWAIESLLNRVINKTLERTPDMMTVLREAVGALPQLVEQLETGRAPAVDAAGIIARAQVISGVQAPAAQAPRPPQPAPAPAAAPSARTPQKQPQRAAMDAGLHDIYAKETAGHLAIIRDFIAACDAVPPPYAVTENLYRSCHTLSGTAKTAGARHGTKIAEPLNRYIRKLHDNSVGMPKEGLEVLKVAVTAMQQVLENIDADTGFFANHAWVIARLNEFEHSLDTEISRLAEALDMTSATPMLVEETSFEEAASEGISVVETVDVNAFEREPEVVEDADADLLAPELFLSPVEKKSSSTGAPQEQPADAGIIVDEVSAEDALDASLELPTLKVQAIELGATEAEWVEEPPTQPVQVSEDAAHDAQPPVAAAPVAPVVAEQDEAEADEDFDPDVAAIFTEEATELLETADQSLSAWVRDRGNNALVFELKRVVHTLKGGARMAGIRAMGDLSHELESFMQLVEAGQVPAEQPVFDALQASLDGLHRMRDAVSRGERCGSARELIARIRALAGHEPLPEAPPVAASPPPVAPVEQRQVPEPAPIPTLVEAVEQPAEEEIDIGDSMEVEAEFGADELGAAAPREAVRVDERIPTVAAAATTGSHAVLDVAAMPPELPPDEDEEEPRTTEQQAPAAILPPGREQQAPERQEFARVDADLLDTMLNNAGEVSIFRSRMEQQVSSIEFNLAELGRTVTRLKDQLRNMELETEAQILHRHQEDQPSRGDFDPLELDRYSMIQQLSRALAESVSDVGSIEGLLENLTREAQNLLLQQARVVTELQNGLMRTRMVPFQRHVQRLSRLVRQVATDTGKRAELVVVGAAGELDRQVLDRMLPPFEHMLRNSVVHGIEMPEERAAAGKPPGGTIKVGLHREGAEMVIVLEDDGRGIDVNAVRERAKERGLLQPGRILSDEEALQLILEPGFSTASSITQHAGRGVGMDVVVTEIKRLGGALFTESTRGAGVKFTIRLPFTLAITQALIVRTGEELYALPLPTVEGVARVQRSEVQKHLAEETPTFNYGGQLYRFQHLGAFVGGGPSAFPEMDVSMPVILIRAGEQSTAIVTDELVGSREMVVKSVGPQIAGIRGIAGATILGDGRIVIILDMGALVRSEWRTRTSFEAVHPVEDKRTFALVVDDSITVRRVTQRLLERNGMRVMTAKDGVDALSILQEHIPDVILLDIEMPRMDGYELASHVRADARLADVPIVMITSRVGEKHRARAIEIGVNDYLGKPYQENQLLDAIEPLVQARRKQAKAS